MDFTLTADHEAIRQTTREFCQRELVPHLRDWDRAQQLPREVIGKMGAAGLPRGLHSPTLRRARL